VVAGGDGDRLACVRHADLDFLGGHHDGAACGDAPLDGDRPCGQGRLRRGSPGAAEPVTLYL
jgi:hypothetical protein